MTTFTFAQRHPDAIEPGNIDIAAAPSDDEESRKYEQFGRVRAWDTNVRAGWMPIANGRKRMIAPDPEYDIE